MPNVIFVHNPIEEQPYSKKSEQGKRRYATMLKIGEKTKMKHIAAELSPGRGLYSSRTIR
jgi:hypothetical protein